MPAPQSTVVAIPLGIAGIDARTDRKAVTAPRLAACSNGSFRRPGAIEKRYGTAPIGNKTWRWPQVASAELTGSIANARAVISHGDELVILSDYRLASYSSVEDRWIQRYGSTAVHPVTIEHGDFFAPTTIDWQEADMAVADGLEVTATGTGDGTLNLNIRDATTGQVRQVQWSGRRPRVLAIGDDILVLWAATGGHIQLVGINRNNVGSLSGSSGVTVVTGDLGAAWLFDVVVSGGRLLLAYLASGGDLKYGYVTPAGALDGSLSTLTPAATPVVLAVCVEPDARYFALTWGMDSNSQVDGRMFAEDKTAVTATTTIDNTVTGYRTMGAVFDPSQEQVINPNILVYYETSGATTRDNLVRVGALTAAGTAGAGVFRRHCGLAAKPWTADGATWLVLAHENTLQRSYVLTRHRAYDEAFGQETTVVGQCLDGSGLLRPLAHLGQVCAVGDDVYQWAAPTREIISGQDQNWRVRTLTFDLDPPIVATEAAGATYVAGGILWRLDAHVTTEAGFLFYPEGTTCTPGSGGGSMSASGTYQYRVHYAITYPSGHREISTAVEVEVTLGGGDDQATLVIPTLTHTNKFEQHNAPVAIVVYRKNPDTTIFQRVSHPDAATFGATANGYIKNDETADTVTWVDRLSDITIESNEPDYLEAELENLPSGPCTVAATGNSRVFVAGGADPDTVYPSKQVSFGQPAEFWDQAIGVTTGRGPVTGMATLADNLIIFRADQTYLVGGDGPDNTGAGVQFTPARLISDDIGCVDPRSIVRIPAGVLVRSRKGIYLLSGTEYTYVGAAVEDELGDGEIVSAVALTDRHEVRFLMADKTLVYDYLAQAWSTWTLGGLSACLWRGQWVVLADEDGTVLVETPGTFTDNGLPYTLRIRLPWIRTGAMQGFQLFQLLLFLGEFRSEHRPVVRIAYDFEEAWIDVFPWDDCSDVVNANTYGSDTPYGEGLYGGETDGLPATTVYQFQVRPSEPRAQAIQIEFEDAPVPGGAALGESYSLSEVAIKIALKPGPMRLGAEKTA